MVKPLLHYLPMMKYKNVFNIILIIAIGFTFATCAGSEAHTLVILHTNDTHSQVEPLELGKRDANCGGYARRMGLVEQERQNNPNVILVDAGDFTQGTPYYNFYHGRIEIDAMNRMGYDAVVLGNHEFDYGVDTLAVVLQKAVFPIVCANYDVSHTALKDIVKPYTVIRRNSLRIGVFGIGIDPRGLISEKNFAPIQYLDPISAAQNAANTLKTTEKCDVVICLSHQGTHPTTDGKLSDIELAKATRNIDIIIGAHTHKIVNNLYVPNVDGDSVLLGQMGKSGARIGKMMLQIEE